MSYTSLHLQLYECYITPTYLWKLRVTQILFNVFHTKWTLQLNLIKQIICIKLNNFNDY